MFKNNKPIPIEAYQCPHCDDIIEGSYETAEKHVNIVLDKPLPEGLIIQDSSGFYHIISGEKGRISNQDHGYLHRQKVYSSNTEHISFELSLEGINSKELKENLKNGNYSLLTNEDFDKVKKNLPDYLAKGLTRIIPELEQLIHSES